MPATWVTLGVDKEGVSARDMQAKAKNSGSALPDVQSKRDHRKVPLDKVGVRGIKYPIVVLDREKEFQHTIGDFTLTVNLPHDFKGTHMSRFIEVLAEQDREVSVYGIPKILSALKRKLSADSAHLEVSFPFFMAKKAPVSGKSSLMEYTGTFIAEQHGSVDFVMQARVPVTTLCPCSKEISSRGAHNQRGIVTARIRFKEHVWLEEMVEAVEDAASCELYPLLKRPDEKFVTEKAYDAPRFVEDVAREIALRFDADPRITWYEIEVENQESIHAHDAYAFVARQKE